MGLLDRMIKKSRQRAETADSEATALEGIRNHIAQIGRGFRRGEPRTSRDRPYIADPVEERRDES